nr:MAG TPA: hypothetical protein [Caudoviricetes sp.]
MKQPRYPAATLNNTRKRNWRITKHPMLRNGGRLAHDSPNT